MPDPNVAIPDNAVMDLSADEKVLPSLTNLLVGLDVLGTPSANTGGPLEAPDTAVAIIESGATKLTKLWAVIVGAAGGVSGLIAWVANFWNTQHDSVRITLIGAGTGLLAVTAVALAVIVASDVRARAHGAAAVYQARAVVAAEFLQASEAAWALKNAPAAQRAELTGDALNAVSNKVDDVTNLTSAGLAAVGGVEGQLNKLLSGVTQVTKDVAGIKQDVAAMKKAGAKSA